MTEYSDTDIEQLLSAVEDLYRLAEAAKSTELTDDEKGTPLASIPVPAIRELAARMDPAAVLALSQSIGDVLYECRGALDYARGDGPTERLARRILDALAPALS